MLFLQTLTRRQKRRHVLFLNSSYVILPRPVRPCKWTSHVCQMTIYRILDLAVSSVVLGLNLTAVLPAGSNGLSLRTTSFLNWKKWWMTSEPLHLSKGVQRIPTWSPYRLKTWRRGSWRLWGDTMGRCPPAQVHLSLTWTSPDPISRLSTTSSDLSFHTKQKMATSLINKDCSLSARSPVGWWESFACGLGWTSDCRLCKLSKQTWFPRKFMFTQSAPRDNKEVALQCCCADSESEK